MRILAVLLSLLAVGCRNERLVTSVDPRCGQSCYDGDSSKAGKGICAFGQWQCEEDAGIACVGWVEKQNRQCNGLDNDCDGILDTTIVACDTICGTGLQTCSQGRLLNDCTAKAPIPEVCNGRDDDCDGQIDEVLELPVEPCYGGHADAGELSYPYADCRPGSFKCESGRKICRNDKQPTSEICDAIDNNCNGEVDENLPGCVNGGAANDLRIILKRDISTDLDLHLLHPDAGDNHIKSNWSGGIPPLDCFYANRMPEWDNSADNRDNPTLDQDVIVGIDPETTTITQPIIGHKYTIGIHVYSYSAAPNPVNASVEIYCGGILNTTQMHTFNQQGNLWIVGTIEFVSQTQCMFTYDGAVLP